MEEHDNMEEYNNQNDTRILKYNTEQEKLRKSEYGRAIQTMVESLNLIEDREKRTEQAVAVIRAMESVNPEVRRQENYERKLWDDLYIISNFTLDIDSPYQMPTPEQISSRPDPIPINKRQMKAMQYGRNIESVIDLIAGLEDGDVKTALIRSLATYMRQQYLIWNKESVADETIFQDLVRLSDGRIQIPEGLELFRINPDAMFSKPGMILNHSKAGDKKKSVQKSKKRK